MALYGHTLEHNPQKLHLSPIIFDVIASILVLPALRSMLALAAAALACVTLSFTSLGDSVATKDYAKVVNLYSSILADLSEIELKRLEYARKHV